jgi:hypothetical protein
LQIILLYRLLRQLPQGAEYQNFQELSSMKSPDEFSTTANPSPATDKGERTTKDAAYAGPYTSDEQAIAIQSTDAPTTIVVESADTPVSAVPDKSAAVKHLEGGNYDEVDGPVSRMLGNQP